ncbi:MAG TPA: aminoglycoside 6-adenylyltransferase [Anaerolineae bacterium]|nr:aminoglycoside 6-adenylyltransferase [Anaerolineae bacterium]
MYEQDRFLTRLQQRVLGHPQITICFLSGSYGRRTNDAYSDLDVALVFTDAATRDNAYNDRRQFAQSVLPYVPAKSFDADHIRPYFHIALYSNGVKVDYRYELQTELQPNYHDKEIRVLKDKDGWAEAYAQNAPSAVPGLTAPTTTELTRLDNRFWVMLWDIDRLLARGDHTKPFPIYLQLLSFTLPTLLAALPTDNPAYQNLLNIYYNHDTNLTRQHLRQLLTHYLAARQAICQRHHLSFSANSSFEREIQSKLK